MSFTDVNPVYPQPGESFHTTFYDVFVNLPEEARFDREIVIELTPDLDAALVSFELNPLYGGNLGLAVSSVAANTYKLELDDVGPPEYSNPDTTRYLVQLNFMAMTAGVGEIKVISSDYFVAGTEAPLAVYPFYGSNGLVDVAQLAVYPPALEDLLLEEPTLQRLWAPHVGGGVDFSVSSGSLPPGTQLTDDGLIVGVPTHLGAYSFTVLAVHNGVSTSQVYSLEVSNDAPEALYVVFRDADSSRTVNQGDVLCVRIDEPVSLGVKASLVFAPSLASDSFGAGYSVGMPDDRSIDITLGASPVLAELGTNSAILVLGQSDGVRDTGDLGLSAGVVEIVPEGRDYSALLELAVGHAIAPIEVFSPPFSGRTITASFLPAGLSLSFLPDGAAAIVGTPSDADQGEFVIWSAPPDGEEDSSRVSYVIYDEPLPSFGLYDLNAIEESYGVGEAIYLDLSTADEATPVSATIGGVGLLPLPGFDTYSPGFILPEGTASGELVVSQGTNTSNGGTILVHASPTQESAPVLVGQEVWYSLRVGGGLDRWAYLWGHSFGNSPVLRVNGSPVPTLASGPFYAVASIPDALLGAGGELVLSIQESDPPAGEAPDESEAPPKNECPPQVDGSNDDLRSRYHQLCSIVDAAGDVAGGKGCDEVFWRTLIKHHALKESHLRFRKQFGTGPGRGLTQIEPRRAADAMKGAAGEAGKAGRERAREWLEKKAGKVFSDCVFRRWCEIQEKQSKKWDKDDCAEKVLLEYDQYALMVSRVYYRKFKAKERGRTGGPGPPKPVSGGSGGGSTPPGGPTSGPRIQPGGGYTDAEKCLSFDDWWKYWKGQCKLKSTDPDPTPATVAARKAEYLKRLCDSLEEIYPNESHFFEGACEDCELDPSGIITVTVP